MLLSVVKGHANTLPLAPTFSAFLSSVSANSLASQETSAVIFIHIFKESTSLGNRTIFRTTSDGFFIDDLCGSPHFPVAVAFVKPAALQVRKTALRTTAGNALDPSRIGIPRSPNKVGSFLISERQTP
ncbi:hypothetical protein GE061_015606 [Apolygus lucorum]|uniref:Uncharacterized protein n=1 Tax=Apolygus lucorum TaxID=248454 RepID=A0A8S9XLM1_APOLU|nr:hypothetical protein GE061_015606 [Apolygus lucorum]